MNKGITILLLLFYFCFLAHPGPCRLIAASTSSLHDSLVLSQLFSISYSQELEVFPDSIHRFLGRPPGRFLTDFYIVISFDVWLSSTLHMRPAQFIVLLLRMSGSLNIALSSVYIVLRSYVFSSLLLYYTI